MEDGGKISASIEFMSIYINKADHVFNANWSLFIKINVSHFKPLLIQVIWRHTFIQVLYPKLHNSIIQSREILYSSDWEGANFIFKWVLLMNRNCNYFFQLFILKINPFCIELFI